MPPRLRPAGADDGVEKIGGLSAGVRGIRSGCRRSVPGLFSNPPGGRQTGNFGSRVMLLSPGCSPPAAPAEPGGNTFRLVVRQFSGYFYFSRWPGRLEGCRMLAALIGLRPLLTLALVIRCLSRPTALVPLPPRSPSLGSAFVASVPGKNRQSLAFSRWPGRLEG